MFGKNSKKEPSENNPEKTASSQAENKTEENVTNQPKSPDQQAQTAQSNVNQQSSDQAAQNPANQQSSQNTQNPVEQQNSNTQAAQNSAGQQTSTQSDTKTAGKEASAKDEQIEKLTKERDEYLADLKRDRANFDNYRKQMDLQKETVKQIAVQKTIMDFLPLLDDITRAIDANPETLEPIRKTLDKTLSKLHLEKIDAKPGTEFDPEIHEALAIDENTEGDRDVIADELLAGYRYNGEIIREAKVRVKHSK